MAQFMGRISVHGTGVIAVYIYQSTIITSLDVPDGKGDVLGQTQDCCSGG